MKRLLLSVLLLPLCFFGSPSVDNINKTADFRINSQSWFCSYFAAASIDNRSKLIITLDDGSQWIVCHVNENTALGKIVTEWSKTDEICLNKAKNGRFFLKNLTNGQCHLVDYGGYINSPKAYFIDKIDNGGYTLDSFFFDTNICKSIFFASQDGSRLAVGYWETFYYYQWNVGDRIIINKGPHSDKPNYLIINLDQKNSVWGGLVLWQDD